MNPNHPDDWVNLLAPLVLMAGALGLGIRALGRILPFHVPVGTILGVVVLFGIGVKLGQRVQIAPASFALGWLALGLPVFAWKRWQDTGLAREDRKRRIDQARCHERRRALPPPPSTHTSASGTAPSSRMRGTLP